MSPVEKIVSWIKDKPKWWQHSMRLSLKNGALSSKDLNEIYQVALVEHYILENDEIASLTIQPIDISGFEDETSEVTLKNIEQVINVGALAEDQTLEFSSKGMTVIYGDNGTGKSSYSRILKHACLSRGGTPQILGNVFTDLKTPSSAKIAAIVDGTIGKKEWNLNFVGDLNLKSIRVFDNDVAEHFVTNEDELGYKPSGLHILEDLAESVNYVKRQVTEEIMPGNGFVQLPEFADTNTGKFISKLSGKVDMSKFDQFIATDDEINGLDNLAKEILELKSKSPEQLRKETNDKKRQLTPLKNFITESIERVSDNIFDEIKTKKLEFTNKQKLAEDLRNRVLSGLPIGDVGGEKWQSMWISAEKYLTSTIENIKFPPQKDDNCPLCLQKVGEESAKKMAGFCEFMADEALQESISAKEQLEKYRKNISICDFDITPYESAISLADESIVGFSKATFQLFETINQRKKLFCSEVLPEEIDCLSEEVFKNISNLLEGMESSLESISEDKNIASIIAKKEIQYLEITDKKLFKNNIIHINSNISRYKLVAKYEKLETECKSRPITDANSEICKEEVITPLVEAFDNELEKFGFNRFKVIPKTRGKSGAQLLKLQISNCGESIVSKVASEGEQRCISIACFLAEMRADKRKSAVIFDDPVNSLSHQWSSRVAKRLVTESLNRQVIILTHDIVFYKLLLEESERLDTASLNEICLERSRKRAGIVRKTPPWDALTTGKRIKQLNVMLRDLRKIDQDGTENEFKIAAYSFYGYLREAWERLVEEKLLNQVVTRFGRSIQTNRLKKLVDLTTEDFDRIEEAMSKCSTYFRGHDSAPAVGDPFPTILT